MSKASRRAKKLQQLALSAGGGTNAPNTTQQHSLEADQKQSTVGGHSTTQDEGSGASASSSSRKVLDNPVGDGQRTQWFMVEVVGHRGSKLLPFTHVELKVNDTCSAAFNTIEPKLNLSGKRLTRTISRVGVCTTGNSDDVSWVITPLEMNIANSVSDAFKPNAIQFKLFLETDQSNISEEQKNAFERMKAA